MRPSQGLPFVAATLLTAALTWPTPAAARAIDEHCSRQERLRVPGAAFQQSACLPDLTTTGLAGTPYTDMADQAGLTARGTRTPAGVRGIQIDGYFPDSSRFNATHGLHHDAQFVIRLPDRWNGGLVVTGAPGTRRQYATDTAISDQVLARGYAYAATDKGNNGADFYRDGKRPGDAVAEWNARTTQLTRAARKAVAQRYGHAPRRTYMTGISNGGYLTRWQLENHPELYDGGVDWEGALWTADGPNLLTSLPVAVARMLGSAQDEDLYTVGFARGSEFLWAYHEQAYWGVTQKIYRAEFDPAYDPGCPGPSAGTTPEQTLAPCASDASYDYASRPASVRRAVARVELTGRIGRPLITLHGDLDALLPKATDSDVYARMVDASGRHPLHRYFTIAGGTHVDGLYDTYPDRLRPILPCYRSAFDALVSWVERGTPPPADRTVGRPASGDVLNSCALSTPVAPAAG
ncbi:MULTISPECIES: tannase/feruloyl esterase family alpha/beta hydrolase [unclassified Streptomyces]|uniref:tannase/feruloyl esterase family alpha/beta hydrolase n=1 Tax=unclassified Streptomyces TaxID=2593676 RepID=UPI002365A607|nr:MULTISPECIES: tannase/feruloyl esterase family alpha/beta hydrolase [unclassified Streptomyces]MDF3147468.1 tannase/feruloyl esterase family alpha/beta hydrolase [Streptomyces sp. T21Q-yed]WDF36229.1 tannase/feruloyl esterase family alpha/beta hydrolase [Streptomyces sp. T12]